MEPADVKKVATTLKRAIKVVGTPAYNEMVRNCMAQDLSWKVRASTLLDSISASCICSTMVEIDCGLIAMRALLQGPAKNWENVLLSMGVAGSEPGIEGEEIAPLARENVAAP